MDSYASPVDADDDNIPGIPNPCLAQGTTKEVEIPQANGEKTLVLMAGEDIGGFGACNRVLEFVMAKDACVLFLSIHLRVLIFYRSVCELKPCSFDSVIVPASFVIPAHCSPLRFD